MEGVTAARLGHFNRGVEGGVERKNCGFVFPLRVGILGADQVLMDGVEITERRRGVGA